MRTLEIEITKQGDTWSAKFYGKDGLRDFGHYSENLHELKRRCEDIATDDRFHLGAWKRNPRPSGCYGDSVKWKAIGRDIDAK